MDKIEFSKVMRGLEVFLSVEADLEYINKYYQLFIDEGITIDQIKYAAKQIVLTKKESYGKMPLFAEYLQFIRFDKSIEAEIEAQSVVKLIRSEGADREPVLPEYTKKVLNQRFGGWHNICSTLEDSKIQWFIKEFKEAYLSEIAKDDRLMLPDKEEAGRILKLIKA